MKLEHFTKAIELLTPYHSTELSINKPLDNFVGELGSKRWTIHITKCCPAVINDLIASGYSLGMDKNGLYVEKY